MLYRDGHFIDEELKRASITEKDTCDQLRLHKDDLDSIERLFVEKSGKISFKNRAQ